jgi:nitrate reductase NapAB chaperone NapD
MPKGFATTTLVSPNKDLEGKLVRINIANIRYYFETNDRSGTIIVIGAENNNETTIQVWESVTDIDEMIEDGKS